MFPLTPIGDFQEFFMYTEKMEGENWETYRKSVKIDIIDNLPLQVQVQGGLFSKSKINMYNIKSNWLLGGPL